jgi:uncharacterized protein
MTLFERTLPSAVDPGIANRLAARDWRRIARSLDEEGYALLEDFLTPEECRALVLSYLQEEAFRSRIVMARHGFGQGEYKYWAYPLPAIVSALREALYPPLSEIANRWSALLGDAARYPNRLATYIELCHEAGQAKPTPLLLKYGAGDYNCLHRDLYGEHVFPLQVTVLLSAPGKDFSGGEFVLVEGRPRRQSRVLVVPLQRGDGIIFPVHHRPVRGARGFSRVEFRHGVSRLHRGERYTLGIILHDAR